MNIVYIGNFGVPFSTENHRAWSFNKIGYNVLAVQENQVDVKQIRDLIKKNDVCMVVYSHTHGWEIKGLKKLFTNLKKQGIPTVSVHLDRWAWLERESDVGQEATWFTEYLFMADGSPEAVELYEKHNLNWYYLKPGVVEKEAYMSAPDPVRFPHDIIFVGSKGYHKEYPFRAQLVEWLHKTYGDRFGHYGGDGLGVLRGHDLNQLYASAKVVVGDSCFGNRPRYWSDRVTETIGRGGLLLHPKIKDLPHGIMANYKAGDLDSLQKQIEIWLKYHQDREKLRRAGFEHVRKHETYTNRAKEIVKVVLGA